MIDIETTGTNPGKAAIIQIAAVRFNLKEQTIDTENMFNRCLRPAPLRYWDEDTRGWWMGKNRAVYQQIAAAAEEPGLVINDFVKWVNHSNMEREPIRFWAKPTTFDFTFIASYLEQYGLMNPFHFRYAVDMNSFIRGLACDPMAELNYRQFEGAAHNALIDVINQIANLFDAVNHHRKPELVTA